MSARAWLDLGTNLDREVSLRQAVGMLAEQVTVVRSSHVYETAPVGFADQPNFFNLCVEIQTVLGPEELRVRLGGIENRMGRVRGPNKYGPRNIDIDVVLHEAGALVHEQVESQAFVLLPLCELIPDYIHPTRRVPLSELLRQLEISPGSIARVELPGFPL